MKILQILQTSTYLVRNLTRNLVSANRLLWRLLKAVILRIEKRVVDPDVLTFFLQAK